MVTYDMSHKEYHGLPITVISNSYLGRLLKCPAAARISSVETPSMVFGRAFHSLLLDGAESYGKEYAVIKELSRRSKDGKAMLERLQQKGIMPLTRDDDVYIHLMANSVKAHPVAAALLKEGKAEVSVFWTDEETGIECKCRPDWLPPVDVVVDIKTAVSVEPAAFARAAVRYGYVRGAAFYLDGCKAAGLGVTDYIFVCVETHAPYKVAVYTLPTEAIERGRQQYRELLQLELKCRTEGYPAYSSGTLEVLQIPGL